MRIKGVRYSNACFFVCGSCCSTFSFLCRPLFVVLLPFFCSLYCLIFFKVNFVIGIAGITLSALTHHHQNIILECMPTQPWITHNKYPRMSSNFNNNILKLENRMFQENKTRIKIYILMLIPL